MATEIPDITEEVLLGRTLLEQGHVGTAQRILVRACQQNPDHAEGLRCLGDLLRRKGDDARSRVLLEYAEELLVVPGTGPRIIEVFSSEAVPEAPSSPAGPQPASPPTAARTAPPPVPGQTAAAVPGQTAAAVPGQMAAVPGQPAAAGPGQPAAVPGQTAAATFATTPSSQSARTAPPPVPGQTVPPVAAQAGAPAVPESRPAPNAPQPVVLSKPTAAPAAAASLAAQAPVLAMPTLPLGPTAADGAVAMPVAAPARPSPARRRRALFVSAGLAVLALVGTGGWLAYRAQRGDRQPRVTAAESLERALASGALDGLMQARDRARVGMAGTTPDPDVLVRLALVNALLCSEYALDARKDAEEALRRLVPGAEPSPRRAAQVEAVHALLALATGDREAARGHADAAMRASPGEPPAEALLVSARVRVLAGDADGAAQLLDRALATSPDFAPVAVAWAAARLDSGDPAAARRALRELVKKAQHNARAYLLLAEAERALGERGWAKNLDHACRDDAKLSRAVRAACALASAHDARLDGERSSAVRRARTAAQSTDDPHLLGAASLLLAGLGEVDLAENILARARKLADQGAAALAWADLAVRLGRNQTALSPLDAFVKKASTPERHMVALRAAYARGGPPALAAAVKSIPPALTDLDADLRAFSALARDELSRAELAALDKRSDRGNPVAAFVLGLRQQKKNDLKAAAKRLERALAGHGDACQAAIVYVASMQALPRAPAPRAAALRALRARNAGCPVPEL